MTHCAVALLKKCFFAPIVARMVIDDRIVALHDKARILGMSVTQLCRESGLSHTTFGRWLRGASPRLESLRRVEQRLKELEESRDEWACGAPPDDE